jgi:hypothetical protein
MGAGSYVNLAFTSIRSEKPVGRPVPSDFELYPVGTLRTVADVRRAGRIGKNPYIDQATGEMNA